MARGDGSIFKRGNVYWVCYYLRGEQMREAAKDRHGKKTNDRAVAEKFLKATMKQIHGDEVGGLPFATPESRRLTVHDLLETLKTQFERERQASPQNLSHLRRADMDFGHYRAVGLADDIFTDYQKDRLAQGDKPASINRPLQMIRQAYNLAIKKIPRAPSVTLLSERDNVRTGFFTEQEFRNVLAHLPVDLRDFVEFAGATGMRRNELASLTWDMVHEGELQIPGDITKNRKPRVLPISGDLAAIIERRRAAQCIEENGGSVRMIEHIFHRDGQPIREFRKSWARGCVAAKVGAMVCPKCKSEGNALTCPACNAATEYHGRIFHDLRRFAIRNNVKAGVSTQIAKKWSGHASDSVFERYSILTTDDMREAQQKTEQYREQAAQRRVVAMR